MVRKFTLGLMSLTLLSGCLSTPQPSNDEIADACLMLKENRHWYKALRNSAKDWGAPMGYQLAVIKQESNFDRKAKPAREKGFLFGLFPGKRPSTAYGYAQALDTTWDTYKRETRNGGADRHDFDDSVDFIGWYYANSGKITGLSQYDYRGHYLAYHEGPNGYLRGSWRKKRWLVNTANKVSSNAQRYESQIRNCKGLKRKFLGIF